ncbi:hypothetical protein AGABI1DRAFT_109437 [Agaricus bisporus var. burnettii JB137-S8]|uniref:F-box domain-containing protein n=1 Tax=Agaricus bisporus var. burnettii (strain JB137-S8 / ATCC MYA-4627 / FGSC 10392) TaxID=597362 RepID=K5WXB9_AGABU|nr:uncharacterized protein AGABI1DRAFT_109437 [Agaricus bisporus var. burnettii JB137-S8]EKM75468.1 hypothetical protein AGABI1DRAFT_109437 [Agaricus bisporus var. burnettii JB137-S8]
MHNNSMDVMFHPSCLPPPILRSTAFLYISRRIQDIQVLVSAAQTMSKNSSRRLPVEILGEIFSCVVGQIQLHVPEFHPAGSPSPWDVALFTVVSASGFNDRDSGDGELSILSALFLKPLMEHIPRWETVALCVSLDTLLSYLSLNGPVQYTCLRRLCIDHGYRTFTENSVGLFRDAPLLSCVSLSELPYRDSSFDDDDIGIPSSKISHLSQLPWSQISHLRLSADNGDFDNLLDILRNTPNLITFEYWISYNYYSDEDPLPLELSHLEQIEFSNWCHESDDGSPAAPFFKILTAPQLSTLEVEGVCGDMELESIQGCLQRSRCSIKCLTLLSPCLSFLLGLTPDVETLAFSNSLIRPDDDNYSIESPFDDRPLPEVELAHLQKIVWSINYNEADDEDGRDAISQLFGLLMAPQLSVLEVVGECCDREVDGIRGFLQKSGCSLKSLKFSTPRLLSFLSVTPDIESLALPSCDEEVLMTLLQNLTFDHSASSWLCPKLKKIVLDFDITAGRLFDAFITMLKSRLSPPRNSLVRLQSFELELGKRVPTHMKSWIQREMTSQEPLAITYARQVPSHDDRWDL